LLKVIGLGGLLLGHALIDHAHDVGFLHDQVLDAIKFDFRARPLAEQDAVADLDVDRDPTAITSPCEGFSFAVSGMIMPPVVFSSASIRSTTMRS
jgi:hypothetical protein